MSAPKWTEERLDDGSAIWLEYVIQPLPLAFTVNMDDGICQGTLRDDSGGTVVWVGPKRRTLKGAHNDCKRHAKKLRAALVQFDRAKLP